MGLRLEMVYFQTCRGKLSLIQSSNWKKDPMKSDSYRPILLTNILCKLMEKTINNRIWRTFRTNNIIPPYQSGYTSFHSTMNELISIQMQIWLNNLCVSAENHPEETRYNAHHSLKNYNRNVQNQPHCCYPSRSKRTISHI